jgi:glycine betaine/proline transport system substrate-binding protein
MSLLFVFAACASTAPEPQVVEREVTKEVRVEVTKEVPVEVTKEVPVEVTKEVRVEVEKEVIKEVMMSPPAMAMPGEGVTVRPGRANWNTGYFHEALYSLALEQLGYDVQEHQELDNAIFYQSLANGDLDFWANGWFPLHDQFEDTWSQGAEIAGTVIKGGGMQGYLVDKASVEKFGIMTLADFAQPEIKAAFDHDGDGKADLYGCSDGWGCNKVIDHQIAAFGLSDHVNHNTAAYNAMFADVKARYNNGESVLYYTWAPNSTLTKGFGLSPGSDVIWIEVPSLSHPVITDESMVKIPGVAGCVGGNDPCFMGFAANDINVVANSKFLQDNPAAAHLFEVMRISLGDALAQNNRMEAGENSQEDIDNHAREWAAINADVWNGWLDEARAAAK